MRVSSISRGRLSNDVMVQPMNAALLEAPALLETSAKPALSCLQTLSISGVALLKNKDAKCTAIQLSDVVGQMKGYAKGRDKWGETGTNLGNMWCSTRCSENFIYIQLK